MIRPYVYTTLSIQGRSQTPDILLMLYIMRLHVAKVVASKAGVDMDPIDPLDPLQAQLQRLLDKLYSKGRELLLVSFTIPRQSDS